MTSSACPLYTTSRNLDLAHRQCCHTYVRTFPYTTRTHPSCSLYTHTSTNPHNQITKRRPDRNTFIIYTPNLDMSLIHATYYLYVWRRVLSHCEWRCAKCGQSSALMWMCVGERGDVMFRLGAVSGVEDKLLEQCNDQRWKSEPELGVSVGF